MKDFVAGEEIKASEINSNFDECVLTATPQTIAGIKTFSSVPVSSGTPVADSDITNKVYVDNEAKNISGLIEPVRAFDLYYKNDTGWRMVMVSINTACSGSTNSNASATGSVGSGTPTATIVAVVGQGTQGAIQSYVFQMVFWIPPNYYYKIAQSVGVNATISINEWFEVDLI